MRTTRKRAIVIVTCLLGAAGIAAFVILARPPRGSQVEMVLQTVSLTNTDYGPMPVATHGFGAYLRKMLIMSRK